MLRNVAERFSLTEFRHLLVGMQCSLAKIKQSLLSSKSSKFLVTVLNKSLFYDQILETCLFPVQTGNVPSEEGWHGRVPLGKLLFLFLLPYVHRSCSVKREKRTEASMTLLHCPRSSSIRCLVCWQPTGSDTVVNSLMARELEPQCRDSGTGRGGVRIQMLL